MWHGWEGICALPTYYWGLLSCDAPGGGLVGPPGVPPHCAHPKLNKDGDGVGQDWELTLPKIWIYRDPASSSPSDNQNSLVRRVSTWRHSPQTCLQPSTDSCLENIWQGFSSLLSQQRQGCHGQGSHFAVSVLLNDKSWHRCPLVGAPALCFSALLPSK